MACVMGKPIIQGAAINLSRDFRHSGLLRVESLSSQWRRSGLKSGGKNPWRALEILKNDKNLGGQPVLASPTANYGGFFPCPP
jgi:hypothetical protein